MFWLIFALCVACFLAGAFVWFKFGEKILSLAFLIAYFVVGVWEALKEFWKKIRGK